ncbi:YbaB/EbfC family nucleoid-associated protein [Nocardia albiluteola]|uniref:YbaB/EbfC family nucleoid-associated protein n=1 Tax=Nocardia albiluteola TaxID=2842303 RepID=UPI001FDA5857|nr:YbaB/EbfC family nucleoid-associated protein [Nocardia albiluteola]
MEYEFDKAELEGMLADAQQQLRDIASIQQRRAQLVGTATASNRRVTVSVNANGVVIETKFGPGIENLGFSAIARAVTEAAQRASEDLAAKNRELVAPLEGRRARMPRINDLVAGMPDLLGQMPKPPEPSLAPPNSDDREPTPGENTLHFTNVESYDHDRGPQRRTTEAGW